MIKSKKKSNSKSVINQGKVGSAGVDKLDFVVIGRSNGRNAIQVIQKYCPDIILMGTDLPIRDGITACHLIRIDLTS